MPEAPAAGARFNSSGGRESKPKVPFRDYQLFKRLFKGHRGYGVLTQSQVFEELLHQLGTNSSCEWPSEVGFAVVFLGGHRVVSGCLVGFCLFGFL